ncbi:hypothetical protein EBZ35_05820 [bacterium]|nr:hypothetical protein [bacterium]
MSSCHPHRHGTLLSCVQDWWPLVAVVAWVDHHWGSHTRWPHNGTRLMLKHTAIPIPCPSFLIRLLP